MNDAWWDRAQSSYERAQSHYDNMEPPEYPECVWCDGTGKLIVASVYDVYDKERPWPSESPEAEVRCPFCLDGAKPPQPDPDSKYDLLREEQWDGDWEMQRQDSLKNLPR